MIIKRLRELGDREALNIKELKNNEIFIIFIIIFFKENPSASSVFSGLEDFLVQEYSSLFNKNLRLVAENSQRS